MTVGQFRNLVAKEIEKCHHRMMALKCLNNHFYAVLEDGICVEVEVNGSEVLMDYTGLTFNELVRA